MDNYKGLNKYEKLAVVQESNYCRGERHAVAVYLNALRKDDRKTINYYESFGETPHKFFSNVRNYEQGLLFGFNDITYNEYDWLGRPQFLDIEKFEFPHREGWAISNDITIGRGLNGKWTYGISYSCGTGGYGSGISVWGDLFDNRKECLITALKEMMDGHKDGKGDKYSVRVLKHVKELFDTITGRKVIQLELF